ncbi:hypothetical protein BJX99DRAFT_218048 [Aspergillus californicus]
MAVQFCEVCGNLLDACPNEASECELCGKTAKNRTLNHTQSSTSENFPPRLRNKLRSTTQLVSSGPSGPRVDTDCAKCPSQVAIYTEAQLRSADEGSTIFYTCISCGHRWREDN